MASATKETIFYLFIPPQTSSSAFFAPFSSGEKSRLLIGWQSRGDISLKRGAKEEREELFAGNNVSEWQKGLSNILATRPVFTRTERPFQESFDFFSAKVHRKSSPTATQKRGCSSTIKDGYRENFRREKKRGVTTCKTRTFRSGRVLRFSIWEKSSFQSGG